MPVAHLHNVYVFFLYVPLFCVFVCIIEGHLVDWLTLVNVYVDLVVFTRIAGTS